MLKIHQKLNVDMLHGSLIKNILLFSLPLMLTGILQLLYNAADIIVVGQFAESGSIGAVGVTSQIINLIVNTVIGLSVGSCVVVARYFGAGNYKGVSRAVHTSILLSLIMGIVVAIIGFFTSRLILTACSTPSDIIDRSTIYMQIYFLGSPFNLVYNFGAAILRAVGETKKPLTYLTIAGLVNVALNLVFVLIFHLGVAGVAIATVISQVISCILVTICLMRSSGAIQLQFKKLKIHKKEFISIMQMGLPAGIQSALFSLSNVLIQSSVNTFGSVVVEGNAAGGSIDSFIYTAMNSVSQAAISFTSQNYGAKNYKRLPHVLGACCVVVTAVGIIISGLIYIFRYQLIGIYINTPEPVATASERLFYFCMTYFLCGIMETLAGAMRGLNYSVLPMIVSLVGACVFRIIWIYTIFAMAPSMVSLYISYPVSWILTVLAHFICYIIALKRLKKRNPELFAKKVEE